MHGQYTALMSLALDREATPEQEQRLQMHIDACRSCAATWGEWKTLDHRLAGAVVVLPPPSLLPMVMARLDMAPQARGLSRRWWASGVLAAWALAAFVMWGLLAGLLWWGYQNPVAFNLLVSSLTQVVGNIAWAAREAVARMGGARWAALPVGIAIVAATGGCLGALWLWLLARTGTLQRAPAVQLGQGH